MYKHTQNKDRAECNKKEKGEDLMVFYFQKSNIIQNVNPKCSISTTEPPGCSNSVYLFCLFGLPPANRAGC